MKYEKERKRGAIRIGGRLLGKKKGVSQSKGRLGKAVDSGHNQGHYISVILSMAF